MYVPTCTSDSVSTNSLDFSPLNHLGDQASQSGTESKKNETD